jgi:hypothetical protein
MWMKAVSVVVFAGVLLWHLREGKGWVYAVTSAMAVTVMWFGLTWIT